MTIREDQGTGENEIIRAEKRHSPNIYVSINIIREIEKIDMLRST